MRGGSNKFRPSIELYIKQTSLISKTAYLPVILAFTYLTIYNFIDSNRYIDLYDSLVMIDNIMVFFAIVGFISGGYKKWKLEVIRCFSFVIILNILTEYARYYDDIDYFKCYFAILILFIVSFTITSTQTND